MAREVNLPPSAAALSNSMRDIGYSFETAVADLIDNSITAQASAVKIYCLPGAEEPTVAIWDNGHGMTEERLIEAMRHGAHAGERSERDLGRFGLGLKTASFSQCKRLTVVSAHEGVLSGAEWNLDVVGEKDDWVISVLEQDEINSLVQGLQCFPEGLGKSGTLVVWRALDRLFENEVGNRRNDVVDEKLAVMREHLELVFHRFLAGKTQHWKRLSISVNNVALEPFDPFCLGNQATQTLPEEPVKIGKQRITIQPYILPHHSKFTEKEYGEFKARSEFLANQGAYVYRNNRLMAWGDWFRLAPMGEATRLARVQIDFPSSLDEYWTIDIKKSRAYPPPAVKGSLRKLLDDIMDKSTRPYTKRGTKSLRLSHEPLWQRNRKDGVISYGLNRDHPLGKAMQEGLGEEGQQKLGLYLRAVEGALPIDMICADHSVTPEKIDQAADSEEELSALLLTLKEALPDDTAEVFKVVIDSTGLFHSHPEVVSEFMKEHWNE